MAASRGFTLVEVLVAVLLLSMIGFAVTHTCLQAQRVRRIGERQMWATILAAATMERMTAGAAGAADDVADGFEPAARISSWDGAAGVDRIDVIVTWREPEAGEVRLSTLVRR
jgi:prepilin-type N-terminal cleavage/methylation domain-containing protein